MSPEPRTLRAYFHSRLSELKSQLPGVELMLIATEDGLLAATDSTADPEPTDRRAAVVASLAAVAFTAAKEFGRDGMRSMRVACNDGAVLVRSFGQPRRRLIVSVCGAYTDVQRVAQEVHKLAAEIEQRMRPATRVG
jgi:predicted regulator of Ras-like GTPase activity (Roadblock/LC7/MglB family)